MVLLKTTLALLSVLATLSPAVDARSSLTRRRCRATTGSDGGASGNGGVINVGGKPTSTPDDGPDPTSTDDKPTQTGSSSGKPSGCFPSANFTTPDSPKGISVDDWWCSRSSEYAFMGFSFAVDACPSKSSMTSSFQQMKSDYNARYVRLYGACDRNGFTSDVVDAAYDAGVGVYALVWFGFTGGDKWKDRLEDIVSAVDSNPKAKYVIRNIAIGSEALFDNAISASNLVSQINKLKDRVSNTGIEVSTSEMAYKLGDAQNVLDAVDNVQLNILPFFSGQATTGGNARGNVMGDLQRMAQATGNKKKVVTTQCGWPSNDKVWKANSRSAIASVSSEKAFYDLLYDMCPDMKDGPGGGFGYFAHIWDDNGLPGWGITSGGNPKFEFKGRTKC